MVKPATMAVSVFMPGSHGICLASMSHFNIHVAKGIKARVALTQQNWTVAAQLAAEARQSFNLRTNAKYLLGFNNIGNQ